MGVVIREAKLLSRQELVRSAFMLVGTESPVIGGAIESRRQIYGLLHLPEVENKLTAAFPNIGEREQMRDQLGQFISDSFRRVGRTPNRQQAINLLGEALRNPQLNFNNTLDVFTSPNPLQRYTEVSQEVNKIRLTKAYVAPDRVGPLSSVESQLIEKFGSRTILSDQDIERFVRAINVTDTAKKSAEALKAQITTNREQLLEQGVDGEFLDQAISEVQREQRAIDTVNTPQTLLERGQKLATTVNEKARRITNQITINRIGGMVDEAGGDRLKEGYGPRARNDVRDLVFGEFVEITDEDLPRVQQRIQELLSLDDDLLRSVKNSEIRFSVALERQRERNRSVSPKPPVPPTAYPPVAIDITPTAPPTAPKPSGVLIPTPPPDETIMDARQLEEIRKQNNRERLNSLLDEVSRKLNDIDLDSQDITDIERQRINAVVRWLGQRAYNYPNAPRAMEEYPRLLEQVRILREQLINRQREDTDRDARTGR